MKIFKTEYDGHIVVVDGDTIFDYEGSSLCPKNVQEKIKEEAPEEIPYFAHEAIAYGVVTD